MRRYYGSAVIILSTNSEIRRILAESRYDWHLSTSSEARAALDEEENNYLLRYGDLCSELPGRDYGGLEGLMKRESCL